MEIESLIINKYTPEHMGSDPQGGTCRFSDIDYEFHWVWKEDRVIVYKFKKNNILYPLRDQTRAKLVERQLRIMGRQGIESEIKPVGAFQKAPRQ